MKVTKTCGRKGCNKKFTKEGKGCTKAKYCSKKCARIVRCQVLHDRKDIYLETQRQKKGYIIPDEEDLRFYGYKEPLSKFEEGYGYKGVVSYSKERDKVQCHFCGRLFRNVGSHAAFAHGLSASEYKEKTGLAQKTALVGEGTRDKLILAHKDISSFSHVGKTKEEIKAHMKAMSAKADKNKRKTKWTLERRNENGNCPDQLIDKIKKLEDKIGRRPTAKEYAKEYGSFQSIITVYGTWEEALRIAGISTYTEEKSVRSDPNFLIAQLKQFYKKHKRTARTSDMKRGLVPPHQTYHKVFGSLNNARILAGVPVIIPISKYRYDEVLIEDVDNKLAKQLKLI